MFPVLILQTWSFSLKSGSLHRNSFLLFLLPSWTPAISNFFLALATVIYFWMSEVLNLKKKRFSLSLMILRQCIKYQHVNHECTCMWHLLSHASKTLVNTYNRTQGAYNPLKYILKSPVYNSNLLEVMSGLFLPAS